MRDARQPVMNICRTALQDRSVILLIHSEKVLYGNPSDDRVIHAHLERAILLSVGCVRACERLMMPVCAPARRDKTRTNSIPTCAPHATNCVSGLLLQME